MSLKVCCCVYAAILCQFTVVLCCTQSTFENTRIIALENIVLNGEVTDYNFFTNMDPDFVVPIRRITGCITPTDDFEEVVAIQIRNEKVSIFYEGAVQNLPFLHSLHVESCEVNILKPKAFQSLPSFTSIKIIDNNINSIPENVFNNLMVKVLVLTFNNISYIAPGAFNDMPRLEIINLNNNKLATWNADWFLNCPKVEVLSVKSNELTTLPARAFRNIEEKLQRIYLAYNNIHYISPRTFTGLRRLADLSLVKNNITELHDSTFLYLENLKMIDLSETSISCFPDVLLNSLRPDVLLWVNNTPLNETCRTSLEEWAKENNNHLTFFKILKRIPTSTAKPNKIRF
ncbi:hypothetical protein ILUMI_03289 [Ignelater luminosus]|uniref:Uncharacterized protein n=1 Tax=Ignelater luminosus TaxID=2038154 RepID=A0A8K0DG32_IGNLU|nr:hypothetical protein ILUMI_03289 [Ignelater luminosus]